jgi:hypothetical protein
MAKKTVTLIPSTTFGSAVGNYDGSSLSFTSDKHKGDGYYGYADGSHTVAMFPTILEATIRIQATLATEPVDSDWFDVDNVILGNDSTAQSTATTFTFTGNFVWIRAKVTDFQAGTITKVQYLN